MLCAEVTFVRPKIRLDPVVKLQEQREDLRLREMAEAGRKLKTAEELLSEPDGEGSDRGRGGLAITALGSLTMGCLDDAVAGWCHYDLGRPRTP